MAEDEKIAVEPGSNECQQCRIFGSFVFLASSGYMLLEGFRHTKRSSRAFYTIASGTLACLGTYRLSK